MSPNLEPNTAARFVRVGSLLPCLVLMVLLMLGSAAGQSTNATYVVGPTYDFGVPLGINRIAGTVDWCDCNGSGQSYNHTVGLMARMEWPSLFGSGWGLSAESGFARSFGRFTSDPYYDIPRSLAGFTLPDTVRYDFTVTSDYSLLHLGLRTDLLLGLGADLRASFGLYGEYRFNGTYEQTLRIQDTATLLFDNGLRERVVGSGNAYSAGRFGWGLTFAAGMMLPLSSSIEFVPEIVSHLSPGDVGSVGIRAFSAGFLFGLRFGDNQAEPAPKPEPRGNENAPQHLAVRLELYSMDTNGDPVSHVELTPLRTSRSELMQLFPYVFFSPGSDSLLAQYEVSDTALPQPPKLPEEMDDPLSCSARSVRTIGMRLRGDAALQVTAIGHTVAGEPAELGRERAERVRALLMKRFGIDSTRIRIGRSVAARSGAEAPPGVEILLPPRLVGPLEHRWLNDEYRSPAIGLRPHIEAAAGLRSWKVEVMYGGQIVGRYSSDRVGEIEPVFSVELRSVEHDTLLAPLRAVLMVEDSSGQQASTTSELPVRARPVGFPKVQRSRCYVWMFDAAWLPSSARNAYDSTIASIARRIVPGTRFRLQPVMFESSEENGADGRDQNAAARNVITREVSQAERTTQIFHALEHAVGHSFADRATIADFPVRKRSESPGHDSIYPVLIELDDGD